MSNPADTLKPVELSMPPAEATTGVETPPGRRLVDGRTAAAKCGCSYRHFLRLADSGLAPYGIKLGHLRRWLLDGPGGLDDWLSGGCRPVRVAGR